MRRVPINNWGGVPLYLWLEPYSLSDYVERRPVPFRNDYLIPPGTRFWVVSPRDLEFQIEVGGYSVEVKGKPRDVAFPSVVILVHGEVADLEVVDDAGVVQGYADPPGSHSPLPTHPPSKSVG